MPALLLAATVSVNLHGQAPPSAELWRLSAASLAQPAGLERGAAGVFWNPAGIDFEHRLMAGLELTQTPDIIGVAGFVAGLHYRLRDGLAATAVFGRADIDDITRTTTSATSDLGTIPVYEQLVGAGLVWRVGSAQAGLMARAHDARFDAIRESGLTLDAGVQATVHQRLTVGAATHFFPLDLVARELTDYYLGVDYWVTTRRLFGQPADFHVRYGASHRERAGTEHGAGLGVRYDERLGADVSFVREQGYVDAAWRPVIGLSLQIGRYLVRAGRGSGLNGIGATYRIGLESRIIE